MKYDVVIAGGGTAGAILAARLSEDPARAVLLLEAGPDYAGIDALPAKIRDGYTTAADITPSDHDWGFIGRATPLAGPLGVPRGKVTGGSSAVNGQIFLRGIPEDFDAWAALGNPRVELRAGAALLPAPGARPGLPHRLPRRARARSRCGASRARSGCRPRWPSTAPAWTPASPTART